MGQFRDQLYKQFLLNILKTMDYKARSHLRHTYLTPPPMTGTVTQVFPVKIVPEHLPLLFSGCKYGTKR